MHAFLIAGQDEEANKSQVEKLVKKLAAKPLSFLLTKIADVWEIINFAKISLPHKTAIVIYGLENATPQAQNAFLKSLEEPQENLTYILTAANTEAVLPTIVSRCQVIETGSTNPEAETKDRKEMEKFFKAKIGERLTAISKITKREEAAQFMTSLIRTGHPAMLKTPGLAGFLEAAHQTLLALKANGNVQLQLTNFVVKGAP